MSSILRKLQKRNHFNLSEGNAIPMRMGFLYPIYVNHLVPGDTFDIKSHIAARFAPMQAPMMSQIDIKTWGFAVPYRLVWDDYKEFFTGKNKNNDDVSPVFPRVDYTNFDSSGDLIIQDIANNHMLGSLCESLDMPHLVTSNTEDVTVAKIRKFPTCSMLEPRVYQTIYNEWFRDPNLSDPVSFGTDSFIYDFKSVRATTEYNELVTLRKKCFEKDYFTSALPMPSLAPDVSIPLEGDVVYDNPNNNAGVVRTATGSVPTADSPLKTNLTLGEGRSLSTQQTGGARVDAVYDPNGTLRAVDNNATIRDLTYSKAVYQYLLDISRGGRMRYRDFVKTLFNVNVPDYRAEIPEYIGGGSQPVIVSEVLQTSETNETPQGNMSGRAISVGKPHQFYYKAKEHTVIMILACVMPKTSYGCGLPKRHFKFDKFDYYIPQFDHIGDQEIKRKELNFNIGKEQQEQTFGYTPRFSEYKSSVSRVHGVFRDSLAYWTLARLLGDTIPYLHETFMELPRAMADRPFYVGNDSQSAEYLVEHVYVEIGNQVDAWRPMSKKSTPIV